MLSPQAASSESDEDFHSLNGGREDRNAGDDDTAAAAAAGADVGDGPPLTPPLHPLKSMQAPFEESIVEANLDNRRPQSQSNAELRRQKLLDAAKFDDSWTTRWRQRAEAQHHPLLKLMAQITFGMHLLQQNQAKSDQEVVKILQGHVDEVDNFLEQTTEDFTLAIRDIEERTRFLQLPMQHVKVFNIMLDDKQFRSQLLEGNDKIEKIIDRTARAMNAALLDVSKGRQATRELGRYLNSVQYTWPTEKPDLDAIYVAMRGNEEGWKKCYKDLQAQGNLLGNRLIELGTIISEMSKMAAAASRRVAVQHATPSGADRSRLDPAAVRSRFNPEVRTPTGSAINKPLPKAPGSLDSPVGKSRPPSFHQRFESPRAVAPVPTKPRYDEERPKTAGQLSSKSSSRRTSGPLSSHPIASSRPRSAGNDRSASVAKMNGTAVRSVSQPILTTSPQDGTSLSKDKGFRDAFAESAIGRRLSMRKKTDAAPSAKSATRTPPVKSSASSLKSASQPRLSTVIERPSAAEENPTAPTLPAPEKVNPQPSPASRPESPPLTALPIDPRARVVSLTPSKDKSRHGIFSIMGRSDDTMSNAPSVASSSMKRRPLSIRAFFSKNIRAQ